MVGSALIVLTNLTATNFTTCCAVAPNTVSLTDRNDWCRGQTNTCPLLCQNGQTTANDCDPATLTYKCTCFSGSGPGNVSDYRSTLPAYECEAWYAQCIDAHPNDQNGQQFCQSFACGMQNASLVYLAASGRSAAGATATTGLAGAIGAGAVAGATSSVSTSRSAAAAVATTAVEFGRHYGTAAVGIAGMAVFGLALW